MVVERRYSGRCPVHFEAAIRYRDGRPFQAQARDLSLEGMFLEIAALILPRGTLVDLEFSALGKTWRLSVLVVHSSPGGIGVMLREPQAELYRGLLDIRDGIELQGVARGAEIRHDTGRSP